MDCAIALGAEAAFSRMALGPILGLLVVGFVGRSTPSMPKKKLDKYPLCHRASSLDQGLTASSRPCWSC